MMAMEKTTEAVAEDRRPKTREEFRLAAIWLGRKLAAVANGVSACLAGPCADDEENGICLGYLDGRDR